MCYIVVLELRVERASEDVCGVCVMGLFESARYDAAANCAVVFRSENRIFLQSTASPLRINHCRTPLRINHCVHHGLCSVIPIHAAATAEYARPRHRGESVHMRAAPGPQVG